MDSTVTVLLKRVSIFSDLDEPALFDLAQQCQRRHFKKNEAIFHQGDPGYTMYIVCTGRINVQTETADGEIVHIAHRGPGDYFGEMALIDGKPRMADVVTTENTELLMLHQTLLSAALRRGRALRSRSWRFWRTDCAKRRTIWKRFQEMDALGRVSGVLYDRFTEGSAPEPGGANASRRKSRKNNSPEKSGATRETVNRALKNLKDTGVIRMEGRAIIVLKEDRLGASGRGENRC